jgi:DNA-binding NarL/FixJ family response regulator
MRILLVDDHGPFRDAARMLLEAEACEVVAETESGEGALALAAVSGADVVLVDIYLPGIDGFATAAALAAAPGHPAIVLISSRTLAEVGADRVARCGACGFVHKAELCRAELDRLVAA